MESFNIRSIKKTLLPNMKQLKKFSALLIILLFGLNGLFAQSAESVLDVLRGKFNKVSSYTASARIRADISFLKILPVNATVYFKSKDKFRFKSKGISILPKQGPNMMLKLINDKTNFQSFITGKEIIKGRSQTIIKLIPVQDTSDLILGSIYVDDINMTITKANISTRSMGTVQAEFVYGSQVGYLLPDSVVFTVYVKKFKVPKAVAGDLESSGKKKNKDVKESKMGKIYIRYKDYMINVPVDDKVFK